MTPQPFSPSVTGTATLAVTTATGNVAIAGAVADGPVAVTSAVGGSLCFIAFGSSSVTTTVPGSTGGYPIMPGTTQVLDRGSATYMAAITGTGTATLYVTSGQGI